MHYAHVLEGQLWLLDAECGAEWPVYGNDSGVRLWRFAA